MTRSTWCKVCSTRMWADEDDGRVYCPACGWESGTPTGDFMALYELDNVDGEQG